MASRTNIRSRMNITKEGQVSGRERLNWRTASMSRGEEGPSTQYSFRQPTSNFQINDKSDSIPTCSTAQFTSSNGTADKDFDFSRNDVKARIDSLRISNTTIRPSFAGWRGTFNIPVDLPPREQGCTLDSPLSPNPSEDIFDQRTSDRDSMSPDHISTDKRSIFESHRFQSLRSRKQRDLDLLSQRYKQNQEDWNREADDSINSNDSYPDGNDAGRHRNGLNHRHNLEDTTPNRHRFEDLLVGDRNRLEDDGHSKRRNDSNNVDVFSFSHSPDFITRASVNLKSPEGSVGSNKNKYHYKRVDETHFDSADNKTTTSGDSTCDTISPRSSSGQQWSPEIQTQHEYDDEVSFDRSRKRQTNSRDGNSGRPNNNHFDDSQNLSYNDVENSVLEQSFTRESSKRSSRQQMGLRDAVQGLFARIGRKVGKNETPKLSKDEKIVAIMLERKERQEREKFDREEAHARWEAERIQMERNSSCRRTIDPSSFRRRNSLGGAMDGTGRESSKSRAANAERQAERRKHNKVQQEEQQYQLQLKIENDFQRVNSLRASISQQNLLKSKLKNLQLEQKQEHISHQRRKSMENLSQLKKHIETKQSTAEQNVENMKKDARKSSREDLRSKSEQSRMRLRQLNDEMEQYQAELKEFNEKQLQHADYLVKRVQTERREAARKERIEKEKMLKENRRRLQKEEHRRTAEKEEVMMMKERKREQLIKEKLESLARTRAAARASQLLREEIRNSDDLVLTAKKLAAFQERSFLSSKRSSETESLSSAVTSPTYYMTSQRTNM